MSKRSTPKGEQSSRFDVVEVRPAKSRKPRRQGQAALPPFVLESPCPKCANTNASTQYHAEPDMTMICGPVKGLKGEHMHRICERCGHEWLQACLPETAGGRAAR